MTAGRSLVPSAMFLPGASIRYDALIKQITREVQHARNREANTPYGEYQIVDERRRRSSTDEDNQSESKRLSANSS
jgi:hypothetical protein